MKLQKDNAFVQTLIFNLGKKIDQIVYELFGLSEEKISIIEDSLE